MVYPTWIGREVDRGGIYLFWEEPPDLWLRKGKAGRHQSPNLGGRIACSSNYIVDESDTRGTALLQSDPQFHALMVHHPQLKTLIDNRPDPEPC